jgi:hypothetical protein
LLKLNFSFKEFPHALRKFLFKNFSVKFLIFVAHYKGHERLCELEGQEAVFSGQLLDDRKRIAETVLNIPFVPGVVLVDFSFALVFLINLCHNKQKLCTIA